MNWAEIFKLPAWLLALGVFVFSLAAVYVFVWPGKGIEWNASYYGPYRVNPDIQNLTAFGSELGQVFRDGRGVCVKFKENPFAYCFDAPTGNFVSYDARNKPWRGLGKSPENTDPK